MHIMRTSKYADRIGAMGKKLLRGQENIRKFPLRCIMTGGDACNQSLHYAIRYSESNRFLENNFATKPNLQFVDLGCGLSPMAAQTQTYNPNGRAYCIDFPYVADIHVDTARAVGGGEPTFIKWEDAQTMAKQDRLDAIVAMGVLPYMPLNEQESRLRFINDFIPRFMLEIKYTPTKSKNAPTTVNAFSISRLQKMRMDIQHVNTIETAALTNLIRYLHSFRTALPKSRDFVQNTRSLFLSR